MLENDKTEEVVDIDESTEDETEDVDESSTEDLETLRAELDREREARKKAEQAIIRAKSKVAKPQKEELSVTAVEKVVLQSQGISSDAMELLEKIAALNKTSLMEAKNDPYYLSWVEAKNKEAERQAASLPASKGGRTSKLSIDQKKERFMTSENPSRDEIRELIHHK